MIPRWEAFVYRFIEDTRSEILYMETIETILILACAAFLPIILILGMLP